MEAGQALAESQPSESLGDWQKRFDQQYNRYKKQDSAFSEAFEKELNKVERTLRMTPEKGSGTMPAAESTEASKVSALPTPTPEEVVAAMRKRSPGPVTNRKMLQREGGAGVFGNVGMGSVSGGGLESARLHSVSYRKPSPTSFGSAAPPPQLVTSRGWVDSTLASEKILKWK